MSRHTIGIAITGDGVSPEEVGLGDLADVLARLDRSLSSYAEGKGLELPEGSKASLVAIEGGSEELVLSVDSPYLPVLAGISRAVGLERAGDLPQQAYCELEGLSSSLAKRGWTLVIRPQPEHDIHAASLGAEKPLPAPPSPVHLEGTTTIHARCLRVGGVQPRAELRLSESGSLLFADLSEEVAKALAARLYEEVVLEGRATWDTATWEIKAFHVLRVTSYRRTDPTLAFKELADAAHGRWDGTNAVEYVRALRTDG